jgi:hypothetical protein
MCLSPSRVGLIQPARLHLLVHVIAFCLLSSNVSKPLLPRLIESYVETVTIRDTRLLVSCMCVSAMHIVAAVPNQQVPRKKSTTLVSGDV